LSSNVGKRSEEKSKTHWQEAAQQKNQQLTVKEQLIPE
jgi:hypothetical protein